MVINALRHTSTAKKKGPRRSESAKNDDRKQTLAPAKNDQKDMPI